MRSPTCFAFLYLSLSNLLELVKMEATHIERPTRLTPRNFHLILSMDDPWIVAFLEDFDSRKESELTSLATSVAGLVKVGLVDLDDADNDDLIEAKVSLSTCRLAFY